MSHLLFIKTLPQQLGQPTTIAIVASLGIHALLGLGLPSISEASKQENPRGNVKVMELTPAEESRVPSLAPSPSVPQSLAYQSLPLPYQSQPLPPMPPPPSISYPPLPSYPSLPSANLDDFSLAPLQKGTKSKSSKATKRLGTEGQLGKKGGISNNYQVYGKQIFKRKFSIPQHNQPIDRPRIASGKVTPLSQPTGNATRLPLPTSSKTLPQLPPDNATLPPPPPDTANPVPESDKKSTPNPQPEIAANTPQVTDKEQRIQQLLADQRQIRQSVTYDSKGTSADEYTQKVASLAATTSKLPKKESEITLTPSYPKEACLNKLNGTALIWAKVSANGNLSTELVKSSGYGIFNDKAIQAVNNYTFPKGEQVYVVEVKFDYNKKSCPALAAPSASSDS